MSNPSLRLADVLLTFVLDAKRNRLIETVLLSIHTICFGREIRTLKALKSQCNVIYMYMPNGIISFTIFFLSFPIKI